MIKTFDSERRILLAVGATLLLITSILITDTEIEGDARQNIRMALNLERHGIISLDQVEPRRASMKREPIPLFVLAAGMAGVDLLLGEGIDATDYEKGTRVLLLKHLDLIWILTIYVGTFVGMRFFSKSFKTRLTAAVLATVPFLGIGLHGIWSVFGMSLADPDVLYTDIFATAMLLISSLTLLTAAKRRSYWMIGLAGALFGVLTLSKASFLYIFVGVIPCLAAYLVLKHRLNTKNTFLMTTCMVVCFSLVVAPWIYRNHLHFGGFEIAERAGEVLIVRAIQNTMTPDEYLGTFYAWAPTGRSVIGPILGFDKSDLDKGGRLQRLVRWKGTEFALSDRAAEKAGEPDKAVSYYRKARAEYTRILNKYIAAGVAHPGVEANRELKEMAISSIKEMPLRHLAMTVPYLYRGAPLIFPVLLIGFVIAIRRRHYDFLLFIVPTFGLISFLALFSQFIGRYAAPAIPVTMIVAVLLAVTWRESRVKSSPASKESSSDDVIVEGNSV